VAVAFEAIASIASDEEGLLVTGEAGNNTAGRKKLAYSLVVTCRSQRVTCR
jgi:hypothetical protein